MPSRREAGGSTHFSFGVLIIFLLCLRDGKREARLIFLLESFVLGVLCWTFEVSMDMAKFRAWF